MLCVDDTRSSKCLTFFSCDSIYPALFLLNLRFGLRLFWLYAQITIKINKDIPHTKRGIIVTVVKYR